MNVEEVKKTYAILSHESETEIRLIDTEKENEKRKPPKSVFVKNEQEFRGITDQRDAEERGLIK